MAEKKTKQQYFTIAEAGRLIKGRKLSPVELTRMCLSRIEEADDRVHAYITVTGDMALKEARRAEREVMAGEYRGGMHGIPVGYKDLFMTKGVLTTCHSKVLEEWVPSEDATAVVRLREAGAVMVGKQSLSEFAFGGTNFKLPWPQPANPWDTAYSPGGSSSGSAIGIATGMCLGAMGSDTGGSIRVPSSHVGVVGLKPTFGRVSVKGMVPLSWSLDNAGPMAWTAEDVAIMLQSVAGYDASDPNSAKAPVSDYLQWIDEGVEGMTLGVCDAFMDPKVINGETLKAVESAIGVLKKLGAKVKKVSFPSMRYMDSAWTCIVRAEGYTYHEYNLRHRPEDFGENVRYKLSAGSLYSAADYIQSQRARQVIKAEFLSVMEGVDALVMPTTVKTAERLDEYNLYNPSWTGNLTRTFDMTGQPAVSVPCGFNGKGLPIGFMIAGRPFDEATVLRVAHTYQQNTKWTQKRPAV